MHEAYSEAHRFESKASAQRRYEEEDEEIKAKLIKIARERADALRAEDKRSEKVEGIREKLEDALAVTQQALGLRAKRLDQLKVCPCPCPPPTSLNLISPPHLSRNTSTTSKSCRAAEG